MKSTKLAGRENEGQEMQDQNAQMICVACSVLPLMLTGLGNIDGVCTSRGTTVCQEWNEFASVGTAAHELGHKSVAAVTRLYCTSCYVGKCEGLKCRTMDNDDGLVLPKA